MSETLDVLHLRTSSFEQFPSRDLSYNMSALPVVALDDPSGQAWSPPPSTPLLRTRSCIYSL